MYICLLVYIDTPILLIDYIAYKTNICTIIKPAGLMYCTVYGLAKVKTLELNFVIIIANANEYKMQHNAVS